MAGAGFALGPAFLILAAFILLGPRFVSLPEHHPVTVNRADIGSLPLRTAPRHPGAIDRGGFEMGCNECHALFWSPAEVSKPLTQHQHIQLDHGMNDRCYNCHDRFNRHLLVLAGGRTIPFDQSPRLCAGCHGPTYRDWELGIHGRTAGSWDNSTGVQSRLACTQCHDPHAPAFAPMSLLPGPNTLRMKAAGHKNGHSADDHHEAHDNNHAGGKRNPLRQHAPQNHDKSHPPAHEAPGKEPH